MGQRKVREWTEVYEGDTLFYSLWAPYPFTKNIKGKEFKLARVRIWDVDEESFINDKHLEDPDIKEFYEVIKSPGTEYGAEKWYWYGYENDFHLYGTKEVRDEIVSLQENSVAK